MRSKNPVLILGLAALVSLGALTAPARAGRTAVPAAASVSCELGCLRTEAPWLVRAWSWLVSLFLEDNGGIVPENDSRS